MSYLISLTCLKSIIVSTFRALSFQLAPLFISLSSFLTYVYIDENNVLLRVKITSVNRNIASKTRHLAEETSSPGRIKHPGV